ncbi:putative ribonuclease H-like domain-containing protein [Tanacetum coccineum]
MRFLKKLLSQYQLPNSEEGGNGNSKKRIHWKDRVIRILPPDTTAEIHVEWSDAKESGKPSELGLECMKSKLPSKTSLSAQNVAFVSQSKSSTNKVKSGFTSTYSTCTPSTSSTNTPEKEALAGFADEIAMIAYTMKKFYKKQEGEFVLMKSARSVFDKKKLECFNCHNTGHFARECTAKGTHDGKKKRDSFYQHQEAGKQEKNQLGLLTIDDGDQEAQILAYSQVVKKLEAQLENWNEICKRKGTIAENIRFMERFIQESLEIEINSGMSSSSKIGLGYEIKSNNEEPQESEPSVSVDRSSEYSTCQSNDSAGSIGTSTEHSVDLESEISRVPPEVYVSTPITTNEKGVSALKSKEKMAREAKFKKQRVFNNGNGVAKPVWTNANRVNHTNPFVPRSVQLNAGRPNINSVRPNVNIGRTNVNHVRPRVNTGSSNVNTVRSRQPDHPLKNMVDRGIFDSGCLGHMTAVKNTEEKVESRTSSTNSKKEEILTEPQQEKEASSTDTSEDNPKILAFRRELEEIALKHLGTVFENNSTSTPSVNSGSEPVNTGRLDPDDLPMPELKIFHKSETGIFDEASYDEEGVITDFNSLPTEIEFSPTPTLRIHNIHPKSQILDDPKSAVQTRSKEEPKKIFEALQDDSWVQAMQERGRNVMSYDKVFAHVARIEAIRLFLAFASFMRFIVYQMDVKSAFIYDTIDEGVYVSQPPGFVDPDHPKKIIGYKRGTIDKTLFIKRDKKDIMLIQVYVDDIIFRSTKKSWCDEFQALMQSRFQISSMGELTFFLRLQVKQNTEGIFISQDKYVAEILKKFDLVSVKTAITTMETKVALTKDKEDVERKNPTQFGLMVPRESPFDLEAFSDSDYGGSNLDRKSITGGCQFLGQRLILWQYKKQTIVVTSTTEAEYIAAANCCGQQLKETKQTFGKAILTLVERVKSLEVALKRKTKRVLLSDSEEEETEARESINNIKEEFKESAGTGLDFEEVKSAFKEVNTGGIKVSTGIEEINAGSLDVNTGSDPVTTVRQRKVSVPSHKIGMFRCIRKKLGKGRSGQTSSFGFISAQKMAEEARIKQRNKIKGRISSVFNHNRDTEEDWDTIRAKLKANAKLKESVLGKDLTIEDYAKKDGRQQRKDLKRFGEELQTKTTKKLKFDDESTQPTEEKVEEDKDDKPTKKTGERRKQIARKGLHTDLDKDDSEDLDEASEKGDSTSRAMYPLASEVAKQCWYKKLQEENQIRIATTLKMMKSKLANGIPPCPNRHKDMAMSSEQTAHERLLKSVNG